MPGRLRLKAVPPADGAGPLWALRDALAARDGITRVEYRPASQSLVIQHDPERWDPVSLPEIAEAHGFSYTEEPESPPVTPLSIPTPESAEVAAPQAVLRLLDPQALLMMAFLWSWVRAAIRGTAGFNEYLIILLSLVNLFQHWQRKAPVRPAPAAAQEGHG
jgi:hypothetical protein